MNALESHYQVLTVIIVLRLKINRKNTPEKKTKEEQGYKKILRPQLSNTMTMSMITSLDLEF